jgi:hypothetical protein
MDHYRTNGGPIIPNIELVPFFICSCLYACHKGRMRGSYNERSFLYAILRIYSDECAALKIHQEDLGVAFQGASTAPEHGLW